MFLGRETLPARYLINNLSRTREESCSALAVIVSLRKILCSPPESCLILSRQSLVNSSKTQKMVSIFSLNGRHKCFPKCHCIALPYNWQSGHISTQYKNQNTPLLSGAKGLKLIRPFSYFFSQSVSLIKTQVELQPCKPLCVSAKEVIFKSCMHQYQGSAPGRVSENLAFPQGWSLCT